MKRISTLLALLLLTAIMLTAVGCERDKKPSADSDTETVTAAETEEKKDWADLPAAEALDQLMALQDTETPSDPADMENGKIDVDVNMIVCMTMDGMQSTTTLPVKITLVLDGESLYVNGNLLGSAAELTYCDGMLYMTSLEDVDELSKLRSPMTPEEFGEVSALLFGLGETGGEEPAVPELPGIADLKPSELFALVTSEVDSTSGELLITGKGFNTRLSTDLAPLLQPMLESMGLVGGGEWDESGELITDPAATLAEVIGLLTGLNEETMKVTFIFDKNGILTSTAVDITLSMEETAEGVNTKSDLQIKGSFSVKVGGQTVTPPADADSYAEEDWRVIFGMETADMLDLVPDAENCVTLSTDPALRERQILYIYDHADEFTESGVLIHAEGYLIDTYVVDEETATLPAHVGALEGLISLRRPGAEEEDYTTVLSFQIPESAKGEGYPAEGTYVRATYCKIELVEESAFGSYMYLLLAGFTA